MADLYTTYDNDAVLGKDLPSIAELEFVNGEATGFGGPGVSAFIIFAKFDKGGCENMPKMSALNTQYPDVSFAGVSFDPEKAHVERFLQKAEYETNFPIAYDPEGVFRKALKAVSAVGAIGTHIYIVKDGKIVWHQQVSQIHQVEKSNFAQQLDRVVKGEPLLSAGDRVIEEAEEESSSDDGVVPDDGDMSLF